MIMLCDNQMSRSDISKDVALFGQDLDIFLKPLIERSLIHASNDTYSLTNQGELFLAQIWPIVEQTQEMILQGCGEQELSMFKIFLEKLQNNCSKLLL